MATPSRGIAAQGTTRKMTGFEIATREIAKANAKIAREQELTKELMAEAIEEARTRRQS